MRRVTVTKNQLRQLMRARLRQQSPETRAAHSAAICAAVSRHPAYRVAARVMVFDAMLSEPTLESLWTGPAADPHRSWIFPRVVDRALELVELTDPAELGPRTPAHAYREPPAGSGRLVPAAAIEMVLVPGLAFTARGDRLGRGGGYYDRLLALLSPAIPRIGLCFALQLVQDLPLEEHDQPLDAVLTEISS